MIILGQPQKIDCGLCGIGQGQLCLSSHIEGQDFVLESLLEANHHDLIFPEKHFDLHLGDFLFYNMGTQLKENGIWSHNTAYNTLYKVDMMLLNWLVSDAFSDIYHFAVTENPAHKLGILPPQFSPTIPDLEKITVVNHQRVLASKLKLSLVQNVARATSPIL